MSAATRPAAGARPGKGNEVPRILVYGAMLLLCLLVVPPAIVARVRAAPSSHRRIALIQDMDVQARFDAQAPNPLFADGRSMRPDIEGAVARHAFVERTVFTDGGADGAWATELPPQLELSESLMARGQQRFQIYCALCHGYAGFGDGIINDRAMALLSNASGPVNGTVWVQPKSLHEPTVIDQPVGQIFHTITYGIRNMAGYAAQIPVEDRWAIAAYVKALQLSQNASLQDVPPDKRQLLR